MNWIKAGIEVHGGLGGTANPRGESWPPHHRDRGNSGNNSVEKSFITGYDTTAVTAEITGEITG